MFGPPVKFRRIFISRLIFFEATVLRTLMTHLSVFTMSIPSKTCTPSKIYKYDRGGWHTSSPPSTFHHQLDERSHIDLGHSSQPENFLEIPKIKCSARHDHDEAYSNSP